MVTTVRIGKRLKCLRCGKEWHARQTQIRICPTCKTKYWNIPRPSLKKQVVA